MAGRDITEGDGNVWPLAGDGLPIARGTADIGVVSSSSVWQNTNISYDIALAGKPFIYATTDERPYLRQTAAFKKDQFDNNSEPGEQSLTGWWIRSQSSFHGGAGIKFYDPSAGEVTAHRFFDSKGVDVWTKGQVTLLKSCAEGHITTGAVLSNNRVQQRLHAIEWNGTKGVLLQDEYDVDKIAADGTITHFIDYNAGAGVYPVLSICNDGTYAYWITNVTSGGTTKLTVYKKPLTGSSASTADEVKMFDATGVISNAIIEYVKDRLILCADNKVYEFSTIATALPSPVYTHPTSTHLYTSISASGAAIYIAGYNGIQSTIQKFTLNTSGSMPALTSAIVAAELPVGEITHKIYYYLGFLMIGTNKGMRAAAVSDQDGSLNYGPIIVETSQPCYDFAARDSYVWCATSVNGEPGLIRIDLAHEISTLRYAYANDVYYDGVTGHHTTACAFVDGTERIAFATAYASGTNGHVYIENADELRTTGYITTGNIRYGTLEPKHFERLIGRGTFTNGSMTLEVVDKAGNEYDLISYDSAVPAVEVTTSQPSSAQEYVAYKFLLYRDADTSSLGPIFNGYQAKATIATTRQRIMQFYVYCFDEETDRYNVKFGYNGKALERLQALEEAESTGEIVTFQDFTTNESFQVSIEQIAFSRLTPPDKDSNGMGGILQITVRTV